MSFGSHSSARFIGNPRLGRSPEQHGLLHVFFENFPSPSFLAFPVTISLTPFKTELLDPDFRLDSKADKEDDASIVEVGVDVTLIWEFSVGSVSGVES